MNFCLPKEYTDKFLGALRSGFLDPVKLAEMTSAERRAMFAAVVGERNAMQVNALFESKLLLKNFERGVVTWAKSVGGLNKQQARDLQTTLGKLERVFSPEEEAQFLADLAQKKLGVEVTVEEAAVIGELTKIANKAREEFEISGKSGYGAARVALEKYVNDLKLGEGVKREGFVNPLEGDKLDALRQNIKATWNFLANNSRAIVSSLDNSFWFRQGFRALTDPRYTRVWAANFAKSWADIAKTIGGNISKASAKDLLFNKDSAKVGDAIIDGVKAIAYESPNFNRYQAKVGRGPSGTKLEIGVGEEPFPTSFPEKIPLVGRFFKGSQVAYEAGAMRLRMDLADKIYAWAERTGLDMTDNVQVGHLNEVINSMTGRGTFGKRVGSIEKGINAAFFSIKFFKSNLDYLINHPWGMKFGATKATQLAATNLLYTVAVTGVILKIAQSLNERDNKDIFNPTSPNFGKIKNGRMTFDLTHGAGGIVVAMARILTQQTTSGTTGETTALGEKYGSRTGDDVVWDFLANKFSPMFRVVRETVISNKTFEGEKPTLTNQATNLTPITYQNIYDFRKEDNAKRIIGLIADGLGISTSVYTPPKK